MKDPKVKLYPVLKSYIEKLSFDAIPDIRKKELQSLIDFIEYKYANKEPIKLNFICTHNSRRSQYAQIWAQTAADYFGIDISCYSGGIEVTEFNKRAVEAIKKAGFKISSKGDVNPVYFIFYSDDSEPVSAYSKLFDDPINATTEFAAVMTCSHADENCPFIPGTEKRISLPYEDPKKFDGTPEESKMYEERSWQIANEMFYVLSKIRP